MSPKKHPNGPRESPRSLRMAHLRDLEMTLLDRRQRLRSLLQTQQPSPGADAGGDFADDALQSLTVEAYAGDLERVSNDLQQIEEALARMREGYYGVCLACGGHIPITRLKAIPTAAHCLQCQELEDRGIHVE